MADIHPTAIVDPAADVADGVAIGPYCVIGPHVRLAQGVRLLGHVSVSGRTTIGDETEIYPFASIGSPPQDLKYKGEPSELVIGRRNRIREHVTMNTGTEGGGMVTRIGDDGLFMTGAHVAHDCKLGNRVVMANNATLAGHVEVGDFAFLGGLCAVHQFSRIGTHAMIGGLTGVERDVIPYGLVTGDRASLQGLNLVGLRRRGFNREQIGALQQAYARLFVDEGTLAERIEAVRSAYAGIEPVDELLAFVTGPTKRALCLPAKGDGG